VYRKQVRRRRAVLALLIVGSFALLTLTYGRGSTGVQSGVSAVLNPVASVLDRALKPARDLVNWFDETFDARGKNSRLHSELEKARKQAVGGQAALAENAELRKLLHLDKSGAIPSGYEPVTAEVISRSPTVWYSDVTIDVGSSDGVAVEDPVIDGDGLVGKVSAVGGGFCKVTLITDSSSAVSAKAVPGGLQGLLTATVGEPNTLIMEFINSDKSLYKGLEVVTAGWKAPGGLEARFPPNIPIGEVTSASFVEQETQAIVHVRPYADVRNMETVQVLTGGSRE
jgi:rod shape-determining protein MreC